VKLFRNRCTITVQLINNYFVIAAQLFLCHPMISLLCIPIRCHRFYYLNLRTLPSLSSSLPSSSLSSALVCSLLLSSAIALRLHGSCMIDSLCIAFSCGLLSFAFCFSLHSHIPPLHLKSSWFLPLPRPSLSQTHTHSHSHSHSHFHTAPQQTIIDMRGPDARILSDMTDFNSSSSTYSSSSSSSSSGEQKSHSQKSHSQKSHSTFHCSRSFNTFPNPFPNPTQILVFIPTPSSFSFPLLS
jgi:hypothetical protein